MLVVCLIFIAGCKKDNNGMVYYENFFKMNFTDNDSRGWAILHTLDGKSVIDAKRITGNTSVDFGKINTDRVTVTYISVYGDIYDSFIMIQLI